MTNSTAPEAVLLGPGGEGLIQKTPGVCGGRACVWHTRIPVWLLVETVKQGASDEELLNRFVVPLTRADLEAAWAYYHGHPLEIDQDIWENRACMVDHRGGMSAPVWFLVLGRRLGLSDERIGEAFYPTLSREVLQMAWEYYGQHREEVDREIQEHQRI